MKCSNCPFQKGTEDCGHRHNNKLYIGKDGEPGCRRPANAIRREELREWQYADEDALSARVIALIKSAGGKPSLTIGKLCHMIGLDRYAPTIRGRKIYYSAYRNRWCGQQDDLDALVTAGILTRTDAGHGQPEDVMYALNAAGLQWLSRIKGFSITVKR